MSSPPTASPQCPPHLRQFIEYAVSSPSADNSQPWVFELDGDTVVCHYRHRGDALDPFGADGHGTLIAAGALHENIDRLLAALGLAAAERIGPPGWALRFPVPRAAIPDSPELRALLNRHTNRHPYRQIANPDPASLPISPSALSRVVCIEDREAIRTLGRAVGMCAEARFNTRNLHEWLFTSLRWSPEGVARGDGLDLATVHLPPGGGFFMRFISPWPRMAMLNRFGIYKLLAAADTDPVNRAPCLIAIVGRSSPQGAWDAGRHLQRIWIELNRRGYAVHPYYVITDLTNRLDAGTLDDRWRGRVAAAKALVRDQLVVGADEQLHMLLRIGAPTKSAVRSRRRPPETFFA